MSLSTRLLVSYAYLATLVLLAAGTAVVGFFDVGRGIEDVVKKNTQTVQTTTKMLEALERQDSATLTALIEKGEGREALDEADGAFEEKLEELRGRATSEEEKESLDRIRRLYERYREARATLLEARHDQPLRAYERSTFPKFKSVKKKVVELLDRQHGQMSDGGRGARADATRYGSWLGFLVLVALLSLVLLTRGLQDVVLDRINAIRDVAEAVASGDHHRRVRINTDDELGTIGRQFNDILDRLHELDRNTSGQIGAVKRQLVSLLETGWGDAALYDVDGRLVASTFEGESERADAYRSGSEVVVDEGRALLEEARQADEAVNPSSSCELPDGTEVQLVVVAGPTGRPGGWIADLKSAD